MQKKKLYLTTVGVLDGERLDVEADDSLRVLVNLVVLNDDVHVVVQDVRLGALHVTCVKQKHLGRQWFSFKQNSARI